MEYLLHIINKNIRQKLGKEIKFLMNNLVVLFVEENDSILCIKKCYDEINKEPIVN